MPRSLSALAVASQNAQETGEVWLVLLTITAEGMQPLRVVNNNQDVVSGGNTFIAFPFEIELPSEEPDSPSGARLRIDNVDKRIVEAIRSISSPPSVTLQVVLASQPNTIELSFEGLTLRGVTYDADSVRGDLVFEAIYTEPITLSIIPTRFPGLF